MPEKPAQHDGGPVEQWPWFGLQQGGNVIHRSDYRPRSACGRQMDFAGLYFLEVVWRDMPQLRCGSCLTYKGAPA